MYNIKVDVESAAEIVYKILKDDIKELKKILVKMEETGEANGMFSWDYDEDEKKITKLIKHLEKASEYYKVQ